MWKKIQSFLRKYRLIIGKYYWDRKKRQDIYLEENFIERNRIRSILFLRQDGKVGDMVVHTMIFRAIKERYPNIKIGVITKGAARGIIENNPNVDKIYSYNKKEIKNLTKKIVEEKYDILVDFSFMLRVRDMELISLCKAKYNFGVNRENWNLFDVSIPFSFQEHITVLYSLFLKRIDIYDFKREYQLFFRDEQAKPEKYVLLNPYAASNNRSFSVNTVIKIGKEILKYPNFHIYIIGEERKKEELQEMLKGLGDRTHIFLSSAISNIFPLVNHAEFIITPDTSIVHIAVALKKKLIAVYRKDGEKEFNSIVWGPNSEMAQILYSSETDVNKWAIENWKQLYKMIENNMEDKNV